LLDLPDLHTAIDRLQVEHPVAPAVDGAPERLGAPASLHLHGEVAGVDAAVDGAAANLAGKPGGQRDVDAAIDGFDIQVAGPLGPIEYRPDPAIDCLQFIGTGALEVDRAVHCGRAGGCIEAPYPDAAVDRLDLGPDPARHPHHVAHLHLEVGPTGATPRVVVLTPAGGAVGVAVEVDGAHPHHAALGLHDCLDQVAVAALDGLVDLHQRGGAAALGHLDAAVDVVDLQAVARPELVGEAVILGHGRCGPQGQCDQRDKVLHGCSPFRSEE